MAAVADVQRQIKDYVHARKVFYLTGGRTFEQERKDLCSDYCKTDVTQVRIDRWLETLPKGTAKEEFVRCFTEWNNKLSQGLLTRTSPPPLSADDFIRRVNQLYKSYLPVLRGAAFTRRVETQQQLQSTLLPELKTSYPQAVFDNYVILEEEEELRAYIEDCLNSAQFRGQTPKLCRVYDVGKSGSLNFL